MDLDLLVTDIDLLCTMHSHDADPLGRIERAAVGFRAGRVAWVGSASDAPNARERVDGRGTIGLPGLVDCHTHAVWAGSRADEYRRRLAGERYTDILKEGGGILSTVRATRAATEDDLAAVCAGRLARMRARGVTTVEIKSGYGLDVDTEVRLLRAARRAGEAAGVRVLTTFLGAHTVPAEHRGDRARYVDEVVEAQLPAVEGLADFIDVYVDEGAFTVEEGRRILEAGRARGLVPRAHAEQVAFTGAAAMAAGVGASSADHLEQIDVAGIAAMARAGTVAVLLPGAMVYLKDPAPPVAALREAGVPMAVATDLNPGTSPVDDLWVCASLACVTVGLTVEEALLGITVNAGRALGRDDLGVVRPGAVGDLVLVRPPPGEPLTVDPLVQFLSAPEVAALVVEGGLV